MIIKVCGILDVGNQAAILSSDIDMIGYNFYKPSKRFISPDKATELAKECNEKAQKVGVFVNESIEQVLEIAAKVSLDFVQLHGDESPEYVDAVAVHVPVIKVFGITDMKDFEQCQAYKNCTYFLFDTKTVLHGGSGIKFSWDLLEHYNNKTPFLLSGGISAEDAEALRNIQHPQFVGVDINSRFELSPGIKDEQLVKEFIGDFRNG